MHYHTVSLITNNQYNATIVTLHCSGDSDFFYFLFLLLECVVQCPTAAITARGESSKAAALKSLLTYAIAVIGHRDHIVLGQALYNDWSPAMFGGHSR